MLHLRKWNWKLAASQITNLMVYARVFHDYWNVCKCFKQCLGRHDKFISKCAEELPKKPVGRLSADSLPTANQQVADRLRKKKNCVIYNGTNFRGAELDVVKTLKAWDQEKVQASLTQRGIDWKFNPPAASHQGGVWDIQKNQKNLTLTGRRPSCYWWAIEDPFGGQGKDFKWQAHHTCLKWPSRFRGSNAKPQSSPASEFVLTPQTRLRNVIDLKLDGSMFRFFRTSFRRGGLQNTCLLSRNTKSGCNQSRTSNWKT